MLSLSRIGRTVGRQLITEFRHSVRYSESTRIRWARGPTPDPTSPRDMNQLGRLRVDELLREYNPLFRHKNLSTRVRIRAWNSTLHMQAYVATCRRTAPPESVDTVDGTLCTTLCQFILGVFISQKDGLTTWVIHRSPDVLTKTEKKSQWTNG